MIKIYDTLVQVDTDGIMINPEPDVVVIDGIEYRKSN